MAKYRTPEQRESIIWVMELKNKLNEYVDEWPSKERNLIKNEIMPQLEKWASQLMEGICLKEGNAIIKLSSRVNSLLVASDFTETDDKIIVDVDDYYKLTEHSLEYCKFSAMVKQINKMTNATKIKQYLKDNFKCQECKDPSTCQLRQVLLTFLVPGLTGDGPCQYYRGDAVKRRMEG